MTSANGNCILFFVKYPTPGCVKTRLAEYIGGQTAAEVYKHFVFDSLVTLRNVDVTFRIFFDPADAQGQFSQWLGSEHSYFPQMGSDLGQRMKNAFQRAFDNEFSRVVILGSDSPDLPTDFLRDSFRMLESHDAVIGPADDGGYYLIGFAKQAFLPEAFEGISWGTDSVLKQTIDILQAYQLNAYVLPKWHDVDTLADLKSLFTRNKNTAFTNSKTFSYLDENSLWSDSDV